MERNEKKWYVIKTKYKCEKYVNDRLLAKGISTYLPLTRKVKNYASKKKVYEIPLINCFVFVNVSEDEYIKVLQTEYVYSFLENGGKKAVVRKEEIDILKKIVGDFDNIKVKSSYDYGIGEKMEIISGHLTGMEGIVQEIKGKHNILISITSIGVQMSIEIDKKYLKPIAQKQMLSL